MSLSNYDIVYACSELFSIYIIYYFFQSLFGTQIQLIPRQILKQYILILQASVLEKWYYSIMR